MEIIDTPLKDVLIIRPDLFEDDRGYFFESYHREKLIQHGFQHQFVQDNEAKSDQGVLRGLHYQVGFHAQAKLVRVVTGSVFDVVVDLREDSPTYSNWYGIELNSQNKFQLFVPRGFAHGYLVLEDDTIFCYKCDNFYERTSEGGIRYNDPTLNIQWPSVSKSFIISEKDQNQAFFGQHKKFYSIDE